LRSLRTWLGSLEGGAPSDRRWRQFVGLMRVAAASEGRLHSMRSTSGWRRT